MGIGAWERGQATEVPCTEASAEPGERSWTDAGVTPRTEKEDPKMDSEKPARRGNETQEEAWKPAEEKVSRARN